MNFGKTLYKYLMPRLGQPGKDNSPLFLNSQAVIFGLKEVQPDPIEPSKEQRDLGLPLVSVECVADEAKGP